MNTNTIDVNKDYYLLKPFVSLFHKDTNDIPLSHLIAKRGNRKIPSNIAIFNMSSATSCPSMKLGLCKAQAQGAKCYAKKAECGKFPTVLPYRNRQEKLWHKITAEEFARQFLMINVFRRKPFIALRVNESGDFHSQACVDKVEKIARILKRNGIKTYMYTSRSDLDFSKVRDAVIHGSGFTKPGIKGIFKIIPNKKAKVKGFSLCKGDCGICGLCQKFSNVCVVKH